MAEEEPVRPGVSRLPAKVGKYRVTGRLGKGAMGVVYSAHDDQVGRDVAIKVMMADLEHEPETRARFYREAQITSRLLHRNIITVFDMGQEEGRLYIVMELLKGATLSEYLRVAEHQHLEQKLDLMIQTCEGLAAAHARGIVHRDIKPGNLFVLNDGTLKILDFGVARIASSTMTASGLILGTPDYMSPEQACGKTVDARSDVFSAAGVFYLMLTGHKPFDARELPVVMHKVIFEDPPPIAEHEAPGPLARIVMKGLAKDPAQRYQQFTELAADLVRFQRHLHSETRQIANSARDRAQLLDRLLVEIDTLRTDLRLGPARHLTASIHAVRQRYPFLYPAAGDATAVLPMRLQRGQVNAILKDLELVLGPIVKAVERLRTADTAVQQAEQALEAGEGRVAVAQFELAANALGERSPRLDSGLTRARTCVAQEQQRDDRRERLLAQAREAAAAADWTRVVTLGEEVLRIEPDSQPGAELLARGQSELAAVAAGRRRRIDDLVARADAQLAQFHFDEADRLLDEAEHIETGTPAAGAGRERVVAARRAAAVREEEGRLARDAIAQARTRFETDREGAVQALVAFAREHPMAPDVGVEVQRLQEEATARRRREDASALAVQSEEAWTREEAAEALRLAERALAIDAANDQARRVQQLARARLKEQAEAAARAEQARQLVERGLQLLAARKPDKAAREIQRALDLEPGRPDAVAALERVRAFEAEAEEERKRAEAEARSRQARACVDRAADLVKAGKFDRATRELQHALDLEPGRPDATRVLEEVRQRQADASAAQKEAEAARARAAAMARELEVAREALRQKDFARATEAAQKALHIDAGQVVVPSEEIREPVAHRVESAVGQSTKRALAAAGPALAAIQRLPRAARLGGIGALVILVAVILILVARPRRPPSAQPDTVPAAPAATAPAASSPVAATQQPAPQTTPPNPVGVSAVVPVAENAGVANGNAGDATKGKTPSGPAPIIRRRPGETLAAWYARDRDVAQRYDLAKADLDAKSFETALAKLTELDQLEPGYRDVAALITASHEGIRTTAQQEMDAGMKAEGGGDLPAALQHYARAAELDPSYREAVQESERRLRTRMKTEGDAALSSARVYEAVGKIPEAIAAYERAVRYLPPDDPNAKVAKERLDALRKTGQAL